MDVFHLDICDPEVGAGALPALRNFVFWRFLGHEMGKRVWSCSSQRWGHSIGTALEASDFLPQGKVFQPRPALFQHCITPGCLSSSNAQRTPGVPQNKPQPGGEWHSSQNQSRRGGFGVLLPGLQLSCFHSLPEILSQVTISLGLCCK